MRVTTLKAWKGSPQAMTAYYTGLARGEQRGDGVGRGPVDYYLVSHPGGTMGPCSDDEHSRHLAASTHRTKVRRNTRHVPWRMSV